MDNLLRFGKIFFNWMPVLVVSIKRLINVFSLDVMQSICYQLLQMIYIYVAGVYIYKVEDYM